MDREWECVRCGDCCRYVAGEDEWVYAELSEEQREVVEEQLDLANRGCKALVRREGEWVCLGQYLFGVGGKPPGCRKFVQRCGMTAKVKVLVESRAQA